MQQAKVTKFLGINNKVDPFRLGFGGDLAQAVNCDIDDSGAIGRRPGMALLSAGDFVNGWCDGGDAFVVMNRPAYGDAAIYQVIADLSLVGVRSSLTPNTRVSFCSAAGKTWYMNGAQSGVISEGVSSAWAANTHVGATNAREYSPPPLGTKLACHLGRMWVVVGKVIYVSEPYAFGKFRLSSRFFQFGTDVLMVRPVAGGVWVSDSVSTGFIGNAESFDGMFYLKRANVPAHEWSENCSLVDLSNTKYQVPGLSAVWSSDDGLCIGTATGELIVTTEDRLLYPSGSSGATVVVNTNVINNVY